MLAKENAAVLPGILLLYDMAWPERATWRARAPAYGALALPFALWLYLRSQVQTHMLIHFMENPLVGAGFLTARLTAVKAIGKLPWLFVWPARLSADYSYNAIPLFGWRLFDWEDAKALAALAVCAGAALLAIHFRHQRKRLFFFLGFFFIALLPTANLVILIGSIMAERFAYLPSVGLAGCAVIATRELARRLPTRPPAAARAAWIGLAFVTLGLAARTYTRNLDWRDELSFWTSTVNVVPGSARPHNNLGDTLSRMPGRLPDAIAEFETALRIWPDYTDAHYNLGNALAQIRGGFPDAIAEYQRALKLEPDFAQAHINLGNLLAQIPGRGPDAIAQFEAALRTDPDLADAHYNLGTILAQIPGRLPRPLPNFKRHCGFSPIPPRPITTWAPSYRKCPAGRLMRLPSVKRRCACNRITQRRTTTWEIFCRRCRAGWPTPLRNTRRRCGATRTWPTRTPTWEARWRIYPDGWPRRSRSTKQLCGSRPIQKCGGDWIGCWRRNGRGSGLPVAGLSTATRAARIGRFTIGWMGEFIGSGGIREVRQGVDGRGTYPKFRNEANF